MLCWLVFVQSASIRAATKLPSPGAPLNVVRALCSHFCSFCLLFWRGFGQDDTHDSIEDARTAMRIHDRYLALIEEGPQALNDAIDHVYETGHRLKWKTRGVTSPSPRGARGRT